jgi:hypothetical protein
LPTIGAVRPGSPGGPSAASPATGSIAPAPTPGVISSQPVVSSGGGLGLAWLFDSIALLLAAAGVGLLAFGRRSPDLQ